MFDKLKDMGGMLKKAKEMKSQMGAIQKELQKAIFSGFGMNKKIEVVVNGEMEVIEIKIDPSVIIPTKPKDLEKGMKEAVNDAIKKSKAEAANKFKGIAGGLNLPGLFN
ncbi:MAG: YbaB/EbfC family nucleoid-associated protein [Candidatus Margulisiibacteriota bacterium]|jgi:hypothetical protein